MSEPRKTIGSLHFGPFELSTESSELRKHGQRLKLSGQAIDVLLMLASNAGMLVTREELQKKLWPGDTFGDFEHGLNAAVNRLRETLGDSATDPTYIETVPRRGYRFIARVNQVPNTTDPTVLDNTVRIVPPGDRTTLPDPTLAVARPWKRTAAVALLVSIVVAGAYLLWKRWHEDRDELRAVPFNALPGNEFPGSFSPDGQQIVFAWDQNKYASWDIFIQSIGAEQPLQLTHHGGLWAAPVWSPDGKSIAFLRTFSGDTYNEIVLIPALGGHEVVLNRTGLWGGSPSTPSWSPDGKYLAFGDLAATAEQSALFLLQRNDLKRTQLTFPPPGTLGDTQPVFSPDGKEISFVRTLSIGVHQIAVLTLASKEVRIVSTEFSAEIFGLAWDEAGRDIVYSSNKSGMYRLWRIPAKGGSSRLIDVGEDAQWPVISARAHRLAYGRAHSDKNIWRVQLGEQGSGEKRAVLIASTRAEDQPQFSPDDSKIAFTSDRSGAPEVWVCNADGSDPVQLTHMAASVTGTPTWSPDGRQIAFDSQLRGHADIYLVGLEGTAPRRVTDDGFDDSDPSWSADGKWIYYSSTATGSWQIWRLPAEGGKAIQVTKGGGVTAFEAADGAMLYYLSPKNCCADIWQKHLPDGEERRFTEIPALLFWNGWHMARGGIYFAGPGTSSQPPKHASEWPQTNPMLLRYFNFATGLTTTVTALNDVRVGVGGFDVSKNDRTVLYTQTDSAGTEIMLVENFH